MAQLFQVHPDNPQARLLKQAVALLTQGGVLAVPTDSSYALVCHLDDKAAIDRLRQIRGVVYSQARRQGKSHNGQSGGNCHKGDCARCHNLSA